MDVSLSKAAQAYKLAKAMGGNAGMGEDNIAIGEAAPQTKGPRFDELVSQGLEEARSAGYGTEAVSTESLANKTELHELVTAVSNADLTLNTVVAIRDRIISAYQDVIKMPI